MPAIGYVSKQSNGSFKGQLKTLSIRAEGEIIPNRSKVGESQPDYRVSAGGVEVGAGWIRTGEASSKDYVSLSLAAQEFGPRRLYANLGRAAGQDDDDAFAVIWTPPTEDERAPRHQTWGLIFAHVGRLSPVFPLSEKLRARRPLDVEQSYPDDVVSASMRSAAPANAGAGIRRSEDDLDFGCRRTAPHAPIVSHGVV